MTDKKFYVDKLQKLQQKKNSNWQKFITSAFEMVQESQDLEERTKEIEELLKAAPEEIKEEPIK
jgi:hypothetical protein